jgi:hypothetical protein
MIDPVAGFAQVVYRCLPYLLRSFGFVDMAAENVAGLITFDVLKYGLAAGMAAPPFRPGYIRVDRV